MKTTILQPTYLPWIGYFEMIDATEQFVMFDHVQYAAKSWQQRNRVRAAHGEAMLTVPVLSDGSQDVAIKDKRVDQRQPWARKHLKTIKLGYQKAPHFDDYYPGMVEVLERKPEKLVDLTSSLILYFIEALGIETTVRRSSEILAGSDDTDLGKTEKVVNLCVKAGATMLYDGAAAADFLELDQFQAAGVEITFQHYEHPTYPQQGKGDFLPYMGVIDVLFNCGPDALAVIRSGANR
jgi:hypothetical protein